MKIRKLNKILVCGCVALLAACSTVEGPTSVNNAPVPPPLPSTGAADVAGAADALGSKIVRHGKFALNTYDTRDEKYIDSLSGNFDWIDEGGALVLALSATTGQTIATIKANDTGAVLNDAKGNVYTAPTADELVYSVVGQRMPVSDIRNWIRGKASDTATSIKRDSSGRISEFRQSDWVVQLFDYDAIGPKRVYLMQDKDAVVTKVRIFAR